MFDINKLLMAASRAGCFCFTAEFTAFLIKGEEGIVLYILGMLIGVTAALGWY